MELFWNSLDNAPSSIDFYLEMKVKVEVGVHNISSRFNPRFQLKSKIIAGSDLDRILETDNFSKSNPRHQKG